MIPDLITIAGSPWKVLPPGIHPATLDDVQTLFSTNRHRRELFEGLVLGSLSLRAAGCAFIFLDGSFVSGKPRPGDYDACWSPEGVNPIALNPVFKTFLNGRANQKYEFKGEFFPSSMTESGCGRSFVDFFQVDRFTGKAKGILEIELTNDPLLKRRSK